MAAPLRDKITRELPDSRRAYSAMKNRGPPLGGVE